MRKNTFYIAFFILHVALVSNAFAVPEVTGVKVTDVTTSSFSVVWMTDVAADPTVEVYSDSSMTNRITDGISITPMPGASAEAASTAGRKGIMKVRVSGLSAATAYYVRAVTPDSANPASIGYSSMQEVTTASKVIPYKYENGSVKAFSNDMASFKAYIQPSNTESKPGVGDLIILESSLSPYPVSAFVGEGINAPEGIIDLNNLFGLDGTSLNILGGEKVVLRIYRGGLLSTLLHYRRIAPNSSSVSVSEPVKGFFADINMDGKVDDDDFNMFKNQYRTLPGDMNYNPDYKFVNDPAGRIDAKDFSRFSREYGRTDIK